MKNCPNCVVEVPTEFDVCWKCNYDFLAEKVLQPQTESEPVGKGHALSLKCLRCETDMKFVGKKKFHEGNRYGVWSESWSHRIDRTVLNMYKCSNCGKVEFFT
jgi:hypothetical protein